jgi:hypothetical protein
MRLQLGVNELLVELPDPGGLKQPVADVSAAESKAIQNQREGAR